MTQDTYYLTSIAPQFLLLVAVVWYTFETFR